jgi:hypothetical protein
MESEIYFSFRYVPALLGSGKIPETCDEENYLVLNNGNIKLDTFYLDKQYKFSLRHYFDSR